MMQSCVVSGQLVVVLALAVFFWASVNPVILELACEVCYPVNESVVTGFLTFWVMITNVAIYSIYSIPHMGK